MFGVSPAFVVSMFGKNFTANQFCETLPIIQELGFVGYQPEIFYAEKLNEWENGGAIKINRSAENLGLVPSQFVAHFLMKCFSNPIELSTDSGMDELKRTIEIVKLFSNCRTLVIPIGPFAGQGSPNFNYDEYYSSFKQGLLDKLVNYLEIINNADLNFAVEILPGSIMQSIHRFINLTKQINSQRFGLCLDTGHAWACRELVTLLPVLLKDRIFGLHLCDNNSDINLSLAPGKGTIEWELFLNNLKLSGYKGTLDIEIICSPDQIKSEYTFGKTYLQKILNEYKLIIDK
jgi:sugar phosphate isomerase/epimerase